MFLRLALGLCLGIPTAASASVQVELKGLSWPARHEWRWVTEQGVPVLYSLVTLSPPEKLKVTDVRGRHARRLDATAPAAKKSREIQILLSVVREQLTVTLAGGKRADLIVTLVPSEPEIAANGCEESGLALSGPEHPMPPFVLGIACSRSVDRAGSKDDVLVTVTAPMDVSWGSTTIFEVGGKGERWRQYQITRAVLDSRGEIGRFGFEHAGVVSEFLLVKRKPNEAEAVDFGQEDEKLVRFKFGGGAGRTHIVTSRVNDAFFQPGIFAQVESRTFYSVLRGGAEIRLLLPVGTGAMAADQIGLDPFLGAAFGVAKFLWIGPSLHFVSMLGHYDSGKVSFTFNQLGFGLDLRAALPRGSSLGFGLVSSGQVPSSNGVFVGAALRYFLPRGPLWRAGVGVSYRKYEIKGTSSSNQFGNAGLDLLWAL